MPKAILYLFLLQLICACQSQSNINSNQISIEKFDRHPFLSDHSRVLRTTDLSGNLIDSETLYNDTGFGCASYLFDKKDVFVLIDSNGEWYEIIQATGEIKEPEWKWMNTPEGELIGRFISTSENSYFLEEMDSCNLGDIYQFKDPR
jgi:hypothetical protein